MEQRHGHDHRVEEGQGLPEVPPSRRAYAALPTSDKTQRLPAMILSFSVSRYSRSVNPRERELTIPSLERSRLPQAHRGLTSDMQSPLASCML